MTNPFAAATTASAPAEAPAETPAYQAPEYTAPASNTTPAADAPTEDAPKNLGIGDPFASPAGVGDGSRITEFVGRLLLVKPTEIIDEMNTSQGKAREVVRADIAVLDDAEEPGRIVEGVLLFQQALKREAGNIYRGPLPYLLGRLDKGKTNGGNTLYTFQEADQAGIDLARQFLQVKTL